MFELIGLIFGGVSRLTQHWLELKDKDKERSHEAVMYDKQIALADKRFEHDASLRRMDAESTEATAEWAALATAVQAQADEASKAGGWVAQFSASIRPLLTFWHAVVVYTLVKVALFTLAFTNGISWESAIVQIYGDADRAMMMSMVSFWFMDRSLRKAGK
jgi:hypothetical protein